MNTDIRCKLTTNTTLHNITTTHNITSDTTNTATPITAIADWFIIMCTISIIDNIMVAIYIYFKYNDDEFTRDTVIAMRIPFILNKILICVLFVVKLCFTVIGMVIFFGECLHVQPSASFAYGVMIIAVSIVWLLFVVPAHGVYLCYKGGASV